MKTKVLRKSIVFLLISLFYTTIAAQNTYNDGHNQFSKIGGIWYVVDSVGNSVYQVDTSVITVRFNTGVSNQQKNNLYSATNVTVLRVNSLGHVYLKIQSTDDVVQIIQQYKNSGLCEIAELNTFGKYHIIPNDLLFYDQVNFEQISDKDIDAPEAWDIETGSSDVIVAVLDNGTDWSHVDLGMGADGYQNIFLNSGEDAWTNPNDPSTGNGVDDDGNGYIDDWKGYNFYADNNDSRNDGSSVLLFWHGTGIAGLVAAKTNNNIGIAGIAGGWNGPGASMMILKIGTTFSINSVNVVDAITYAMENGADIIQMSFGIAYSVAIEEAMEIAYNDYGVFLDCSAGNDGATSVLFPANSQYVISVGSTDNNDIKASDSNYGTDLDIAAPGVSIRTTYPGTYIANANGTSFAAPQIAGVAALMLSVNPCLSPNNIKDILQNTAEKVGGYNYNWDINNPGHSNELGYGRVNAYNAVSTALALIGPDLFIRDSPEDIGSEPNVETANAMGVNFWSSSDIWIRQTNDGLTNQFSEPIEYMASTPNYIYVRVKNKGCPPQTANLKVYWASAGTGLEWPTDWVNNTNNYPGCTATIYGNEITPSTNITVPGLSEQIYVIPWQPNNPDNYSCFLDPFHFCLLARIETSSLPPYGMTFPEGTSVWANTKDNNNIAWKNIIINNDIPGMVRPFGTSIIRNIVEKTRFIKLNFVSKPDDIGQDLSKFKSIRLFFTKDFIKRWAEGGKRGKDVVLINDSVIEVTSSNATMEHIFLRYNEIGSVSLSLLPKKEPVLSNDKYFNFDVIQYSEEGTFPQGGITYQIIKGISDKVCYTSETTLSGVITSNHTFSDSILVTGNILVPNGITLKFEKAIVLIDENIRIRVMPGGKLIINSSELISSCIVKKWAGIEVKGNPVFLNPLTITNSVITGSDFPINLDKSKDIIISGSAFIGDNIGIAIMMNKMKDFQISDNTFINYETGIKTTNTCPADIKSGIERNIFFNVKTAIDFTNDNHSKLDIKCNRFSYTDYAILSNQTLLKDQGQLGEGAGNEFISNSTLANNKLKHINGNSPKYYFDPSQPITSGMNVTTIASITDRICYSYSFDTSSTVNSQKMAPADPIQKSISKKVIDLYSVPNPNSGQASIYYSLGEEKLGELVIMDIFGKVIDRITLINESNKVDVDFSEYTSGIYLISLINSKGEIMNKKMIIAK